MGSLMTIKDNIFSLLQLILNELVLSEFVFQNKKITSGQIMLKLCTVILAVIFSLANSCFEDRFDHLKTEFTQSRQEPIVKLRNGCEIPERKTTTLKTAKFVSECQFATINFRALVDGSILLPTGDQMEKTEELSIQWDGVSWRKSIYGTKNRWASFYYLENIHYFVGLMGVFSFNFNFGKNSFYVNFGNEKTGILYGEIWLGSRALVVQTCGESCAMWCELDTRRLWAEYFISK